MQNSFSVKKEIVLVRQSYSRYFKGENRRVFRWRDKDQLNKYCVAGAFTLIVDHHLARCARCWSFVFWVARRASAERNSSTTRSRMETFRVVSSGPLLPPRTKWKEPGMLTVFGWHMFACLSMITLCFLSLQGALRAFGIRTSDSRAWLPIVLQGTTHASATTITTRMSSYWKTSG